MRSQKKIIGSLGLPVNKKGEFLITLRHEPNRLDVHHKWQITGGGVEYGETPEQALAREFQEELGIQVRILYPYPIVSTNLFYYNGNGLHVLLLTYIVDIAQQQLKPEPSEIAQCLWISPDKIEDFDCLPNTEKIVFEAEKLVKNNDLLSLI